MLAAFPRSLAHRFLPLALLAALPASASAAPQWTEPGGGPLNTYVSTDVAPPMTAPETVWELEVAEILGEPSVQDGVVYVVAKRKRAAELLAVDVTSGDVVHAAKVPVHDFAEVHIDGSTLVVVSGKKATIFDLRSGLKKGRSISGKWKPGAAMLPGAIALHDGELLRVYDLRSGKALPIQDVKGGFEIEGFAAWKTKPIVRDRDASTGSANLVTLRTRHEIAKGKKGKDRELQYDTDAVVLRATGLGTRDASLRLERRFFVNSRLDGEQDHQHIVGFPSSPELPVVAAFCNSRHPADAGKERKYHSIVSEFSLYTVESVTKPAAVGELMVARKADRTLVSLKAGRPDIATVQDGAGDDVEVATARIKELLKGEKAPAETRDGQLSGAGSVVFLGNWAIDVASGKVLWIAPDLTFEGRLIPAADGVVVYSRGDRLVCASDSAGAAGAEGPVVAAGPVTAPGTGDAAILMDGRRIPGEVDVDVDGTVIVTPEDGGDDLRFESEEVSAIEAGGAVEIVQNPWGLVLAWRQVLAKETRESLVPVYEEFVRRRLVPEAQALLDEIDGLGCPDEEKRRLEALLATKRDAKGGTRRKQLAAAVETELEIREARFERRVEAAEWLAVEGLTDAAAGLLAGWTDDWAEHGSKDAAARVDEVAEEWVQPDFPDSLVDPSTSRARSWLPWARELVAAGAAFADHEAAAEKLDEKDEWRNECLVLQTDNIELFTTCEDPLVVGSCLRYAEAGVVTLQQVLDSPYDPEHELMAVRLHKKRSDYLKEKLPNGGSAGRWTAGFYIPSERVSRFYVPDGENSTKVSLALQETLVHELVHQFQNERWAALGDDERNQSPRTLGFWVVEGFARFIEDQVVEMGTGPLRIDDITAPSVEAASALLEKKALIDSRKHVDMNQFIFGALDKSDPIEVSLTSTLGSRYYPEVGIFYEQSGALVFFMMNRCGDEGRERFLDYMATYWRGKTKDEAWKALGFDTLEDFESAFHAFLRDPAKED